MKKNPICISFAITSHEYSNFFLKSEVYFVSA